MPNISNNYCRPGRGHHKDRLLHHCKVVNIKGHSYRLRNHQIGKIGVPKASA